MNQHSFRAKDQLVEYTGQVFKYKDNLTDGSITVLAPLLPSIVQYVFLVPPCCLLLLRLRLRNIYNWAQGRK
jgi:hypothetical protein